MKNLSQDRFIYSNGPRTHEFLLEMNDIFDRHDIMTVGELPNPSLESQVMDCVSAAVRQLNFDVVALNQTSGNHSIPELFTTGDLKRELSKRQTFINAFLESHDQGCSISHFGVIGRKSFGVAVRRCWRLYSRR